MHHPVMKKVGISIGEIRGEGGRHGPKIRRARGFIDRSVQALLISSPKNQRRIRPSMIMRDVRVVLTKDMQAHPDADVIVLKENQLPNSLKMFALGKKVSGRRKAFHEIEKQSGA